MKRIYYLLAFLAGIVTIGYFNLWQGIILSLLLLGVALMQRFSLKQLAAIILLFTMGGGYFCAYNQIIRLTTEAFAENSKSAILKVVSSPKNTSGGNTVVVCKVPGKPFKINLYIRGESFDINYLDTVKINSFTYYSADEDSYSDYLKSENIFGNVTVEREQLVILKKANRWNPLYLFAQCKNHFLSVLKSYFAVEAYQLIAGILLGDKSEQTDDFRNMMSVAGVSHVVVVSGLHFGIWIVMLSWILLRLGLSLKKRSVVLIGATLFFALFMGFTPSIIRVSVMLILNYLCDIYLMNRDDKVAIVIFAAFLSTLGNPNIIFSVSFILSYGAVLGILLFSDRISKALCKIRIRQKSINGVISASLAAQILVFPFLIYYFNQFSTVFILGNLLICLILPFLMGYGIFVLATASLFPAVGSVVSYPLKMLLNFLVQALQWISTLPFAEILVFEVDKSIIIFYFLLLSLFLRAKGWSRLAVLSGFCLLFLSFFFSIANYIGNGVDLICLNIADNTTYLLRDKKNHTVLLDLASEWERNEYANEALMDAIYRYAGGKIDCYIAGGQEQAETYLCIRETVKIGQVWMPEVIRNEKEEHINYLSADETVNMGNIQITLLCQQKDGLITTAIIDYFENHILASAKLNEKRYADIKSDVYDIVMINRYISTVYQKVYGSVAEWNADKIIYNLKNKNEISDCYNIDLYGKIKLKLFPKQNFLIK